jgi:hypothetical protein
MRASLVAFLLLPALAWGQARVDVPSIAPDALKGAPPMTGSSLDAPAVAPFSVVPSVPISGGSVGEGIPLHPLAAVARVAKDIPVNPVTPSQPIKAGKVFDPPALTVPPLDGTSTGAPSLTTGADVAADVARWSAERKRQAAEARVPRGPGTAPPLSLAPLGARPDPTAVAASVSGTTGRPTPDAPAAPDAGCNPDGDLQKLLSPACLATLRSLHAPDGMVSGAAPVAAAPQPEAPGGNVRCTVAVLASGASPAQFAAESLEQCLVVGARMGYGVPGVTNIVAAVQGSIVSVSCRRPPPDGTQVTCQAQQ